jgi:pimeloyl-ACP methyl ester carboxylesterase
MVLMSMKMLSTLLAAMLFAGTAQAQIASGDGEQTATIAGRPFKVATYRPATCSPELLLLVFHGVGRDAGPYRDHAQPLADRLCAFIVAPEFDKERFPRDFYQFGGVAPAGQYVPPGARPVDLVAPLVAWARQATGKPALPYVLIGHSAGAQFVGRVAAFTPTDAARIVIANPSTWVMPNTTDDLPDGFGGVPDADRALRAYLALPILVLLGQDDTGSRYLDVSPKAMAQGPYRLARGRNAFGAAKAMAESRGWTFGWRLVEVPSVGHSAANMFKAAPTIAALSEK